MSLFEELGAGIGSLSLGGHQIENTLHCADDDLMDIDSIESFDFSVDLDNPDLNVHKSENDADQTAEQAEEDTSLLDIFSPTAMGAKYALKPLKLLMPPPPKSPNVADQSIFSENIPRASEPSRTSEHDYEFDTSLSTSVYRNADSLVSRQRNHSEWVPPQSSNFGFSDQSSIFGNSVGPSGQWPRSFQSNPDLQIHHHHYYPPTQKPVHQKGQNFSVQEPSYNQMSLSRQDQPSAYDSTIAKRDHDTIITNLAPARPHQMVLSSTEHSSQMLPSPWDPHAVPAERTPYVLMSYLQLLVNVVLSGYAVHILICMIQTLRQDVAHKLKQEANNLLVEIASCERSYHENFCAPETIVPALEKMCAHWEKCMHQDPSQIGNRSSVSAHTIGMVLNSLIEPLSFKVLFVGALGIMVIFACNFGFGYVRAKTYYGWGTAAKRA